MNVELIRCYGHGTWDLVDVEIPDDTPELEIQDVAEEVFWKQTDAHDVAYLGLYGWYIDEYDDEDDEDDE